MQTLVCKDNYTKFHHLIQLAYDLRVCNLTFSYLEGDYKEKKYLLDESQIMAFKEEIIPLTIEVISNSSADKRAKETMISAVKAFYSLEKNSLANYASGIYQAPVPCSRPGYFSIILANGDVHPCNMVEYTHHPVMGNLHEKRFSEMWQGKEWENFRKNGFDMCQYCPMPLSLTIPVMRAPNFPGIRTLFDNSLLKKAKPHIFKMLIKHRKIFKKMGLYPN
ncbi:SPASM domain-containing protein [bacterium]|nr:SPASM domain-containing protein [bacterium]